MTVEATDDDGKELIFRASNGVVKYRMEDGFGTPAKRDMIMQLMVHHAEARGYPLIDMDEVRERIVAMDDETLRREEMVSIEVEDKAREMPVEIDIEVTSVTDPEREGAFFDVGT